jgi:7-cyano-7-deazaguanine synthase
MQKHVIICLSGGMDSTALLLRYMAGGYKIHGISFDYGQRHAVELVRLQANLEYLRQCQLPIEWQLIDLGTLGRSLASALTSSEWEMPLGHYAEPSMKATFVPNRNAIFSSIAFGIALSVAKQFDQSVCLSLGVHAGDHAIYPDCRPEFYQALFAAFQVGNWDADRVVLELPFLNWDKAQILRDARQSIRELNLDFETIFRNTCTSYLPDEQGVSRGLTGSDVERILAFHRCGLVDPLPYSIPWEQAVAQALELEDQHREAREKQVVRK